jgi:hypothetical protein
MSSLSSTAAMRLALATGVAAVVAGTVWAWKRRRREAQLDRVPTDWWRRAFPVEQRRCYQSKADALNVVRDVNRRLIEQWGGMDTVSSGGEFDAINHRYGLRGKDQVKSVADALWIAMPPGRPFCVDNLDVDTLNETSPGQIGPGFQLPEWVVDEQIEREADRYYASLDP